MPNQRDIIYKNFYFNVATEDGEEWLCIKQGDCDACHVTRQYRIRLRNVINTYIEGPFGGYDESGDAHDDLWRFVIVATRVVDHTVMEREVVLYVPTKEQALSALECITDKIGF